MNHKNRSSQTHSKISLQRFEMGEAKGVREREWEVFFKLEMGFGSCSCVWGEVGVSIYRWSSKLVVWQIFLSETG
jgi:hypothetical protein